MPYKSDAQRKYFHAAMERGEIGKKTVAEFDAASKGMKLPEHVKMAKGGEVCPACGYAMGGEAEEYAEDEAMPSNLDETVTDPDEERRRYANAIRAGSY